MGFIIAIDGPSVSGKSSAAERLSQIYGIPHINSGNIYRIATHILLNNMSNFYEYFSTGDKENRGIFLENISCIIKYLNGFSIEIKEHKYFLNNVEISDQLRTEEINRFVSKIASIPEIREFVNSLIKKILASGSYIIDGRDIGTVLCPSADCKFFLTANVEIRVMRFMKNRKDLVYEEEVEKLKRRDYDDSNRKVAPLRQAKDAILIDSSNLSLEEVIKKMVIVIEERINKI